MSLPVLPASAPPRLPVWTGPAAILVLAYGVVPFIGSDYQNIRQYKELEVSPQAEWVDLNIDLDKKGNPDAIKWDSGLRSQPTLISRKKSGTPR